MCESQWYGFKRMDFTFEGKEAILVFPNKPNKSKTWLLKTEYFDAFQDFERQMIERGWHLAFLKNTTRWCIDEDLDLKKKFADYLSAEYGLCQKCVPVGMSCGGLIATKFAARHPEYVDVLYLDAPVMNFLSCPAGVGKAENTLMEEFIRDMGMGVSELINYRENAIDKKHILLENNIPIVMVYGDSDTIVPYEENGAILEKYYRENGGIISTIGKKDCGHHPHGLTDSTPIIEFIDKNTTIR
jgi:pimeloyl-ACP methyl ester carboxylesterase